MTIRRTSLLTALGSILLLAGILAGLINRNVLDGNRFAGGVDAIRREPAVAKQVGQAMADKLFEVEPDLIAVRPLVEAAATSLATSSAFSAAVRSAARQLHRAFTDDSGQVALRLADVGAVLTAVLTVVAPAAAARLPANLDVTLAHVGSQSFAARIIHLTRIVGLLAWLLPLLAFLAFAAAIWLSPNRLEGMASTGRAVAAAGGGVAVVAAAGTLAVSFVDSQSLHGALIAATWHKFGNVLWWPAAIAVAVGGLLVAASHRRIPRLDLAIAARRAGAWLRRSPANSWTQVARGAGLAGLGVAALLRPALISRALAALVGMLLLVVGVGDLAAAYPEGQPAPPAANWRRARAPVAVAVAVLVMGGLLAVGAAPVDRNVSQPAETTACNGHVELCARPYDDVAFPATHNAMSAADEPGWFIPEQPTGLIGQLHAGIRALLIDTWYGQRTQRPGLIATAPGSHGEALAVAEREFGPQVVASALRVHDAVTTTPSGPIEPYLCHGLCEIGATRWEPVMGELRVWLASHPREVVTLFIEDYVSPADTAAAFSEAGLLPYVHVQRPGKPWPTLGQMIDSGHRVVVLMERHGGGPTYPWLLQAFDTVQDTPYTNPKITDLTCAANRGAPSSPLFLVNYWLSNFHSLVTDARKVNAYDVLWPHLSQCSRQRGRLPNFVAVNYYNEGDLFRAVDELNGLH